MTLNEQAYVSRLEAEVRLLRRQAIDLSQQIRLARRDAEVSMREQKTWRRREHALKLTVHDLRVALGITEDKANGIDG